MHQSYIVRIYRHERGNPHMLVGTVEKVGEGGKSAFTNKDELWDIVTAKTEGEVGMMKRKDETREGSTNNMFGRLKERGEKGGD